tara:strand:- start:10 stop:423 length:414 start_codon:yes stop_codon:yes gene_type:complete
MTTRKEFMTKLVSDYGLILEEDIWKMTRGGKTIAIINRAGIEKIQYASGITITYEPLMLSENLIMLRAFATKGDVTIQTMASAKQGENGNCKSNYVLEVCEKRAKGRAVLMMEGAYMHGVHTEDESDDFKKENKDER